MTETKWIFPDHDANEDAVRQIELDSIRTRTQPLLHELEPKIGEVAFFIFTPERYAYKIIDYESYSENQRHFNRLQSEKNVSVNAVAVYGYDAWHDDQYAYEGSLFIEPLMMAMAAQFNFSPADFIKLKRVTLFCTKTGKHEVKMQGLYTLRDEDKLTSL